MGENRNKHTQPSRERAWRDGQGLAGRSQLCGEAASERPEMVKMFGRGCLLGGSRGGDRGKEAV